MRLKGKPLKIAPDRLEKGLWWDRPLTLVEGCTPVSPACDHCWSAKEAVRRPDEGRLDRSGKHPVYTGKLKLREDKIGLPLRTGKPKAKGGQLGIGKTWAVWNDLFHEDVPFEFIYRAFTIFQEAHWHTFIVCTKRTVRARDFMTKYWKYGPLPNVILMTTVENADQIQRVRNLIDTPALTRGLSMEPLLGYVNISPFVEALDWIIVGGESGPQARPMHPLFVNNIRNVCSLARVPFFFKQWGEWNPYSHRVDAHRHKFDDGTIMTRLGKRQSGRSIDGLIYDGLPKLPKLPKQELFS